MLKRVRLNSQLLFVCWARRMELIVRRSFTFAFIQSSSTLRHKKNKKKSSSRDLSQAKFLYFCAQNISFLPAAHGFLTSNALLRYYIVDVLILRRRRKSRRKGPERERERVWENRTSSIVIIVIPFHHHARRRKSIYLNLR